MNKALEYLREKAIKRVKNDKGEYGAFVIQERAETAIKINTLEMELKSMQEWVDHFYEVRAFSDAKWTKGKMVEKQRELVALMPLGNEGVRKETEKGKNQ